MECRVGSECKSGEEDQYQVTADIDSFNQGSQRQRCENVGVHQGLEHIRGFICGCRCVDDGPCCQQFMDWEIVDSPNERKGDVSQTEGKLYKLY